MASGVDFIVWGISRLTLPPRLLWKPRMPLGVNVKQLILPVHREALGQRPVAVMLAGVVHLPALVGELRVDIVAPFRVQPTRVPEGAAEEHAKQERGNHKPDGHETGDHGLHLARTRPHGSRNSFTPTPP